MNLKRPAYFAITALFCLMIAPSGVMDIVQPDFVVEAMEIIGMPMSALALIGVWKLLGIVALAQPRFTRINEWAYAGFFFDLTGAAWVHWAGGDALYAVVTPLVFLVPLAASYALRDRVNAPAVQLQPQTA